MQILHTPEERFRDLPEYPFKPNYLDIEGVRVHYIDEGDGETILCLYGESELDRDIANKIFSQHG